ncbi:hypothetical protein IQE94_00925 [Synechocystis sp. PCC 7339]|uniref:hypothetical protein n=1 Tax=unclassified Synechocystis TaxID=2640012 RepID=UPI001BAEF100|nr:MULTISPECIES: hypothetical protein [unclassified Synechocystis]QUS60770.1 hypothetical protein HTZ78_08860 [Synechocystis sp. PCC 7338]UAJ72959.1 hypothetical protein IQE94_00925 [Synechocystis sp. PCC 7339]
MGRQMAIAAPLTLVCTQVFFYGQDLLCLGFEPHWRAFAWLFSQICARDVTEFKVMAFFPEGNSGLG